MEEQIPLIQKKRKKSCLSTHAMVMFFVFINCFALRMAGSAQPQYLYSYIETNDKDNTSDKLEFNKSEKEHKNCTSADTFSDDIIQRDASAWTWYIMLAEYGIALPVVLYSGPIADKIGRKPLLLWNTTLMFVSFVMKTLIVYKSFPLYYYVLASGVEGLSGAIYVFNLINHTILADTTSAGNNRSFMMTLYDALLGIGAICSNLVTGYLIQWLGYTYIYAITSGVLFIIPFLIAAILKDPQNRQKGRLEFSVLKLPFSFFSMSCKTDNKRGNPAYFILHLTVLLLVLFPYNTLNTYETLFLLGPPFCWTSEEIGWLGAVGDFVKYIGGTIILKCVHTWCVCIKDGTMVMSGIVSSISYLVFLGLSKNDWMVYGATTTAIIRVVSTPLLKATLSRTVQPEKQGALFSNIYLVEVITALTSSTVFNSIYEQTLSVYRGLIFFAMAAFPLCAFVLMIFVPCTDSPKMQNHLVVTATDIQQADVNQQRETADQN